MSVQRRVQNSTKQKSSLQFFGNAWKNRVKEGRHAGSEYIKISVDRDIEKLELNSDSKILLWDVSSEKRNGKQDPDYRVSLSD